MTAFGDRKYGSAPLLHSTLNHSGAPVSHLIGGVLRQAYYHSQHNARLLMQQSYTINEIKPSNGSTLYITTTTNTYAGIARGWNTILDGFTHLTGFMVGRIASVGRWRFRTALTANEPVRPTCESNSQSTDFLEPTTDDEREILSPFGRRAYASADAIPPTPHRQIITRVSLPLGALLPLLPVNCAISLLVCMERDAAGSAVMSFQPVYAAVYAETKFT